MEFQRLSVSAAAKAIICFFAQTITAGIVSAKGRTGVGLTTFEDFIQTDADINPGNSGGALITATGKLIGINTEIISNSGGSQGIGLAIPVPLVADSYQIRRRAGDQRRAAVMVVLPGMRSTFHQRC